MLSEDYSTYTRRDFIDKIIDYDLTINPPDTHDIIKSFPKSPVRFRGIAGSGKTHILCQLAAHFHAKYPEYIIVYTFFTQSLYPYIRNWIQTYCSLEGVEYDPLDPNSNLKILHAWGSKKADGLYKSLCTYNDIDFFSVGDIEPKNLSPTDKLVKACKIYLQLKDDLNKELDPIIDIILIDEGQDLVTDKDNLLFKSKQPFYWMAFNAIKPQTPEQPYNRPLIWAYDEHQNTTNNKIPTSKELFGDDLHSKRSIIMRKCYRTPKPILMVAHAIGMGLYYPDGMLIGPSQKTEWEALGYKVTGQFRNNNEITITRPDEFSANILPKVTNKDLIKFIQVNNFQEELSYLIRSLQTNIRIEDIKPEEILVIDLGLDKGKKRLIDITKEIENSGNNFYIPSARKKNSIIEGEIPDKFTEKDCITISGIHRAKGNEAYLTYILGLDHIAKNDADVLLRNSLFIAMTRTKGWLEIIGSGNYPFYSELNKVISSVHKDEKLTFIYKKPRVSLDSGLDSNFDAPLHDQYIFSMEDS